MATVDAAVTVDVSTAKLALIPFAPTVTVAGTRATSVLLLASVTTVPPVGAADGSVTVPVGRTWPCTAAGVIEIANVPPPDSPAPPPAAPPAGGGADAGGGEDDEGVGEGDVGEDAPPHPATASVRQSARTLADPWRVVQKACGIDNLSR